MEIEWVAVVLNSVTVAAAAAAAAAAATTAATPVTSYEPNRERNKNIKKKNKK